MGSEQVSRRNLLKTGAAGGAGAVLVNPALAAAQTVGVKAADLPDLTIKEVKVYVVDSGTGTAVTNAGYSRLAAVVTQSGIEGNYTLARRYWHPNWSNEGWLEFAKRMLIGKSVLGLAGVDFAIRSAEPSTGAEFVCFGDRCVPLGHSGQSRGSADLSDPRRLQEPRDGVRQFAASQDGGRVCARGEAVQGRRVQGIQDPPAQHAGRGL